MLHKSVTNVFAKWTQVQVYTAPVRESDVGAGRWVTDCNKSGLLTRFTKRTKMSGCGSGVQGPNNILGPNSILVSK